MKLLLVYKKHEKKKRISKYILLTFFSWPFKSFFLMHLPSSENELTEFNLLVK